jgi:hypothetical protein
MEPLMTEQQTDAALDAAPTPGTEVTFDDRPAVVFTRPKHGANGGVFVGVRYTDVERWETVPGTTLQKPTDGSCAIANVDALSPR